MPGRRPSFHNPLRSPEAADAVLAQVARAVDAMRAGRIVQLRGGTTSGPSILAVETATPGKLRALEAVAGKMYLLLTHARAKTLKIRLYTPGLVALPLAPPLDVDQLRAIADPTADMAAPLKGPFEAARDDLPETWSSAVKLAKLSGLLPAIVVGQTPGESPGTVSVSAGDIESYGEAIADSLRLVTRARVPLSGAEQAELVAFRAGNGEPEHFAIVIGDPPRDRPVLARIHSECFTGDLLGSLRCDCGAQLRGAIQAIAESGGGILVYLAQEGRGIGLVNKLRAYRLQDQGFDTLEANERLGFETDERLYGIAARILALLGFNSVRLMTNNPQKIEALNAAGIDVSERVPHAFPENAHNRDYLLAKAKKSGHLL